MAYVLAGMPTLGLPLWLTIPTLTPNVNTNFSIAPRPVSIRCTGVLARDSHAETHA